MKRLFKSKRFWSLFFLIISLSICGTISITSYPDIFFYIHFVLFVLMFLYTGWIFKTPCGFLSYFFGYEYQYTGNVDDSDDWCKENNISFYRSYNTYYFLAKNSLMAFKLSFTGEK